MQDSVRKDTESTHNLHTLPVHAALIASDIQSGSSDQLWKAYTSYGSGKKAAIRRYIFMEVNSTSSIEYQKYLQRLQAMQEASRTTAEQSAAASFFSTSSSDSSDSYIPSEEESGSDVTIPSEQYNDMKPMMNGMRPMMPPMAPPEDESESTADTASASETEATDDTTDEDTADSIISSISSTMHCRTDSVTAAMEKLGLTEDDLSDEDSLTELLDELNDGAKKLGLPVTSDSAIQDLISNLTGTAGSTEETSVEEV